MSDISPSLHAEVVLRAGNHKAPHPTKPIANLDGRTLSVLTGRAQAALHEGDPSIQF